MSSQTIKETVKTSERPSAKASPQKAATQKASAEIKSDPQKDHDRSKRKLHRRVISQTTQEVREAINSSGADVDRKRYYNPSDKVRIANQLLRKQNMDEIKAKRKKQAEAAQAAAACRPAYTL